MFGTESTRKGDAQLNLLKQRRDLGAALAWAASRLRFARHNGHSRYLRRSARHGCAAPPAPLPLTQLRPSQPQQFLPRVLTDQNSALSLSHRVARSALGIAVARISPW